MGVTLNAYEVVHTVGTTDWSFTADQSGAASQSATGVYQGFFDLSALATGDAFEVRCYEKVPTSGGAQRVVWSSFVTGVQSDPILATPSLLLGVAWDFVCKKISGTDRSITGRIARVGDIADIAYYQVGETVGTTEHSFTTDTSGPDAATVPGVYQAFIDVNALAAGDEFDLTFYEKVASSGGTQRVVWKHHLAGAYTRPILILPSFIAGVGWDLTLKKIAGTDRTINARIAKAV
jgi:hypothetical protein